MDEARFRLCREIADGLLGPARASADTDDITELKLEICGRRQVADVPSDPEVLSVLSPEEKTKLLPLLRRKPVRALSGVSVVAVMTRPFPCPHGKCLYCPGGLASPFGDVPQSYTGLEPAARRGVQAGYDPALQVSGRISSLEAIGHSVSKVELIVMGGTFPATPEGYQRAFIKGCFDGANGGPPAATLEESMRKNETASHRIIGLTVETRPDWCGSPQTAMMLSYGATRVELGVQTLDDRVLAGVGRGHTVADTAAAFAAARDAGLKIVAHMMPFLPGATIGSDLESFRLLFSDGRFMPDELKIYPTQVLAGTGLYGMWKAGKYRPPELEDVIGFLMRVKETVPRFVRIKRILRDIPSTVVDAGVKKSDIRDIVLRRMAAEGRKCQCVRCREIGRAARAAGIKLNPDSIKMGFQTYRASGGTEHFITFDETEHDLLVGLLRLRLAERAIVREMHVYGWSVPVGFQSPAEDFHTAEAVFQSPAEDFHTAEAVFQHKGYGKALLAEAERLAREAGYGTLLVTSGVGAREYYRKRGYSLEGSYMVKGLSRK